MSAEHASDVIGRAALHAALGDPGRLAVVDALLLGDASPTELQRLLGMASNLMAHHLRTLEQAGLVSRRRSDHDRRRTYLRLQPAVLAALVPVTSRSAQRLVFVCTQNSARSQLAAALWAHDGAFTLPVASAGTRPAERVHPGAIAAARRRHLDLRDARPRALRDVRRPGDVVITVCDSAHEQAADVGHGLHWSIADPVPAGDPAAFDRTVDDLAERITRLRPNIRTVA